MSFLSDLSKSLLSWGVQTARTQGQQVAMKAITDAMGQLNAVTEKHAPDVAPAVQQISQQLVATLMAGALSRKG